MKVNISSTKSASKNGNLKITLNCFKKRKRTCIVCMSGVVALIFFGIVYGIYCLAKPSAADTTDVEDNYEFRFVTREEWKAKPPAEDLTPQKIPLTMVIICHTVSQECFTESSCIARVQSVQDIGIGNGFVDIAYNFLVGGDGAVYEGRGWDKVGAHTIGFNTGSIGLAFIGNFEINTPTDKQIKAALAFINEGEKTSNLTTDYKLYGALQVSETVSPGKHLYEIIKRWKHWSEDV